MHKDKLKHNVIDWSNCNAKDAERDFSDAVLKAISSTSPAIDQFSTWLLAGVGITASLMVVNLNKIEPAISKSGIFFSIIMLIISGLFGFLSKSRALYVTNFLYVSQYIKNHALPVLDKYLNNVDQINNIISENNIPPVDTSLDIKCIERNISSAFPRIFRAYFAKNFYKGCNDSLSASKMSANAVLWQSIWATLQLLFFVGFLIVVVLFM